jgi:hypothetical protein
VSESPAPITLRGITFELAPSYSLERDALPDAWHLVGEPYVSDPEEAREWGASPTDRGLLEEAREEAQRKYGRIPLEDWRYDG